MTQNVMKQIKDNQNALVRLESLSMAYTEGETRHEILQDVSINFAKGSFTALLGASGSGKSTLLNLIAGLDKPTNGKIWIADTEITTLSEKERTLFRRRSLGIVFQFFNLLPGLTVLENVLLPLQLNKRGRESTQARDLLKRVGLGDRLDSYPDRLSGGEQQRVAIVRALLHEPMLLLADEPTGNLDETTAHAVASLMLELVRDRKQTLILVTHNPELAESADAIYRVHEGRVETSKKFQAS